MTLKEIMTELGAIDVNGFFGFHNDSPLLDVCPTLLEDDGMGYGVNDEYITCVNPPLEDGENIFWFRTKENKDRIKEIENS